MARKKKVLVTGGTGFIAKHVIRHLLDEGFDVCASVRDVSRGAEVVAAVSDHVKDPQDLDQRLDFVALDLNSDEGWEEALRGKAALIHMASPFPLDQPEKEEDLIAPAVEGTLRALNAAHRGGVSRVILTSSVVSVINRNLPAGRKRYDENDWSDGNFAAINAYSKSKTLAEKAAWNFVRNHPDLKLTTINPALVLGPALDSKIGSSLKVIQRLLSGKDPMVPRLGMTVVDVRDVAQAHVRALQRPESAGLRFIVAERFMWMAEMARLLKAEYPDRNIATRQAPDWLIRLLGLFDKTIAGIVPSLGHETHVDNTQAAEILGIEFIEARQAIKTSAAQLIRDGLVK